MDLPEIGTTVRIVGGRFEKYQWGVVHSYTAKMVYLEIAGLGQRITKKKFVRRLLPQSDGESRDVGNTRENRGGQFGRGCGNSGCGEAREMRRQVEQLRSEVERLSLEVERLKSQ